MRCTLCGEDGHRRNSKIYHSEDKFERCVMKVKAKQTEACARSGYKASSSPPRCYNPWAVCHSTLG